MAPVPVPIRFTGQRERMERIPQALVEHLDTIHFVDICVVQESCVHDVHIHLRKGMQQVGFIYESRPLVGSIMQMKLVHGGVVMFSRYPIVYQDSLIFEGMCDKEDCLAAKGAIYIQVMKDGILYHVFALHLNAWESPTSRAVRRGQMAEVAQFVEKQKIPVDEPVLMLGDFNVDLYSQQSQLRALCDLIKFRPLPRHQKTHPYSSDPSTNQLMGVDDKNAYSSDAYPGGCYHEYMQNLKCVCCPQEWMDYALYSSRHVKVDEDLSWMRVVPVKTSPFTINLTVSVKREIRDLSDHYPVQALFVFPDLKRRHDSEIEDRESFLSPQEYIDNVNESQHMRSGLRIVPIIGFIILGLTLLVVLVVTCIYMRKWNNERAK